MINLPSFGEEYHGTWRNSFVCRTSRSMAIRYPACRGWCPCGTCQIIGNAGEGSFCDWMAAIADGLRPFNDEWGRSFNRSVLLSQWNLSRLRNATDTAETRGERHELTFYCLADLGGQTSAAVNELSTRNASCSAPIDWKYRSGRKSAC